MDLSWQDDAACKGEDIELFYPPRHVSGQAAKRICRDCLVQKDCLIYALKNEEEFGIWGGHSERERRKIRKQYRLQLSRR